jgi:hypothetical protein
MSEPATTTSIAISAGTVTLTGSLLGMSYDALLFGLVGVLFSLRMLPPMSRWQLLIAVITTTMLAALSGPVLAGWAVSRIASIADHENLMQSLAALLVGALAQLVFPAVLAFIRKRVGAES